MDEGLQKPKDIRTITPEDGGSRITLACGHRLWIALAPQDLGPRMYCSWCLDRLLQQVRNRA
jgi:hypothetical protein